MSFKNQIKLFLTNVEDSFIKIKLLYKELKLECRNFRTDSNHSHPLPVMMNKVLSSFHFKSL